VRVDVGILLTSLQPSLLQTSTTETPKATLPELTGLLEPGLPRHFLGQGGGRGQQGRVLGAEPKFSLVLISLARAGNQSLVCLQSLPR
jgi:hypothetical protein